MLIEAKDLTKKYRERGVLALEGVSFALGERRTLGIVGESGAGKSTLARLIARLLDPDAGEISYRGERVTHLGGNRLRDFRRRVQIIFQEPYLSLDPHWTVGQSLEEVYRIRGIRDHQVLRQKVSEQLQLVELDPHFAARRPSELSGGECQRIAIARALGTEPELLICDEAVSSLDVLIRAGILNLLLRLQEERGLSFLFISHDLRVIRHMSDDVLVLKDGKVCEYGPRDKLFGEPQHPYTKLLIGCAGLV